MFQRIKDMSHIMGNIKTSKWIISATKPFIPSIFLLLLLETAAALIGIASSIVSKNVIDKASATASLTMTVALMVILTGSVLVLNTASGLIAKVVNEKFSFHIRLKIFERILRTKWLSITQYHSGDLLTRLKSDVNAVTSGITDVAPSFVMLFVRLVAAFFTLLYYDRSLALFALILGPVTFAVSWVMGRKLKKLQRKVQESESRYSSFLQENLENLLIIKSFSAENSCTEKLKTLYNERMYWVLKKNRMNIIAGSTISFFFSAGYLLAFVWGAVKISLGLISFGTMTVFLSLVSQVQSPIVSLANTIPQFISILVSAERISELNNLDQEGVEGPLQDTAGRIGVKGEKIDFGYTDKKILHRVDFDIAPGDTIAVIGPSGVGKTTLVRLLLNFVSPQNGQIYLYNNEDNLSPVNTSTREMIAYVPQGNTLFSGSISDNLKIARRDASPEEMEEALHTAAADFIFELPEGINTVIGERGHRLSEGQAQRIAIARAIIRKSPILILDEATSALDEITELKILREISQLSPKPTCIIITHRKSALSFCNREIVIEEGEIREISRLK